MLFSNRYKFLFVHIAKTAGTSIQTALKKLRARDPLSYPQLVCYNISKFCGHRIGAKIPRHARLIAALELMPREQFEALFKFAFIRNPWDIQVSAHHHLKHERPELIRENGCEAFGDFLRWSLDPDRPYKYYVDPLNQNMIDYMVNIDGAVLIDHVGRFENLEEDWGEICGRLGVPVMKLPRKRVSRGREDYRAYYDDDLAALVEDHYRRDLDVFGYTFDPAVPSGSLPRTVKPEYSRPLRVEAVTGS